MCTGFAGVFYFGFSVILPVVYAESGPATLWLHHYWCYFMLAEMLVNWACVKWVHSPFRPGDYKPEYGGYTESTRVQWVRGSGGFENSVGTWWA